jgi:hypothetical protein
MLVQVLRLCPRVVCDIMCHIICSSLFCVDIKSLPCYVCYYFSSSQEHNPFAVIRKRLLVLLHTMKPIDTIAALVTMYMFFVYQYVTIEIFRLPKTPLSCPKQVSMAVSSAHFNGYSAASSALPRRTGNTEQPHSLPLLLPSEGKASQSNSCASTNMPSIIPDNTHSGQSHIVPTCATTTKPEVKASEVMAPVSQMNHVERRPQRAFAIQHH